MPEVRTEGLRLLMTADTVGGVWDYSLELATQLARFGIRTVLATMGRLPTPEQRAAATAVPGLLLQESAFRLEWMPDRGADPILAGEWLLSLEERFTPDLVHLNGFCHGALFWKAPCVVVAHSCVLSWWLAVKGEPAPAEWDEYARKVAAGMKGATAVVTPTRALLETMTGLYGPLPGARVIWNGRDPARYRPQAKGSFIFTAGRLWDEAKNVSALAAIGHEIEWPVIAAGDWRHPDGGCRRPGRIDTLGVLSPGEMTEWLARAPIFALPARYEPFGLTVLEAALSGCALVLGDIPTLRELWDGAAVFVPPDDPERLVSALTGLVRNPVRQADLSLAARRRGMTYTAERMARAYHLLYSELLNVAVPHCVPSRRKEEAPGTAIKL